VNRRILAGAGALSAGAVWCGPGAAVHVPGLAAALRVPLALPGMDGVALTFDDGPHPEGTPAVLDALDAGAARATFFLVAEQVERYPQVAAEISRRGHELAIHGYRHRNQMRLSPGTFARDLARAGAIIGEARGAPAWLYRPPYGIFTLAGLAVVRRAGLKPLLWSKWGLDWRAKLTPRQLARMATRTIGPGDVILLHDADWYSRSGSHRITAAAVEPILEELARRGLRTQTPSRAEAEAPEPRILS
jgi:peptidoglycan/xylan/chitin deacetylase (PgdA/CDA1 family)